LKTVVALLFLFTSIHAQTVSEAVLADTLLGNLGRKSIADVRIQGTLVSRQGEDTNGSFSFEATNAGRSRLVINTGKQTRTEIASGPNEPPNCTFSVGYDEPTPMPLHNCMGYANWFLPLLTLSVSQPNLVITATPDTIALKRSTQSTKEALKDLISSLSFAQIETDNNRFPSRLRYSIHPDDDYQTTVPVEILYSDYRDVDGVKIPFSVERRLNGTTIAEFRVQSVQFNTGTEAK